MGKQPIWKEKKIKAPYCPKCGNELEKVTNSDATTIMDYHCNNCHLSL